MYPVVVILRACCEPEIGFSIVQAVMINVVDEEMAGRVYYLPVHPDRNILFADVNGSACIEGI